MPRGRSRAPADAYLKDMGMMGLASAWAMVRHQMRPKQYRRKLNAGTRCSGVCSSQLTWPSQTDLQCKTSWFYMSHRLVFRDFPVFYFIINLFFSFLFTRTMVSKPGKAEGTNITFCPLEIRHSFFSYFVSNNILPLPRSHQHVCAEIKSVILFTVFKTAIFFKNLRPRVKISSAMNDDR